MFQTQIVFQHYVISNSERYFKEPSKFLPERWLKTSRECHHPFASLPFGYGRRMCLGRRFADLELQTITAKVHHIRIKKQMYYFVLSALLGAMKPYTPSINIPGQHSQLSWLQDQVPQPTFLLDQQKDSLIKSTCIFVSADSIFQNRISPQEIELQHSSNVHARWSTKIQNGGQELKQ